MKQYIIFFFLFFNILAINLYSENFENFLKTAKEDIYTENDGLPSSNITYIFQDSKGYIWIGTYDGLVKYNGVFFKEVKYYGESIAVKVIFEDKLGNIYIGTNGAGLIKYANNYMTKYTNYNGLGHNLIRKIIQDKNGDIWVGSLKGLALKKGDEFINKFTSEGLENYSIEALYIDSKNTLWVSNSKGELYYKKDGENFLKYERKELKNKIISDIIELDDKYYFCTRDSGVYILSNNKFEILNTSNQLSSNKINKIIKTKNNNLLVASDDGIFEINENKVFKYNETNGLVNNLVEALLEDREGSIWIGTSRGGLEKVSYGKFLTYTVLDGLTNENVNSILELDKDEYLIGTDNGLSRIKDGKFIKTELEKELKNIRIRNIYRSSNDIVWISTYSDYGLIYYNLKNKKMGYINEDKGLSSNRIRVVFEDSQKRIWVGTKNGLNLLQNYDVKMIFNTANSFNNSTIMAINEDEDGNIWVGTDGEGINIIKNEKVFKSIRKEDGILGNVIFKIIKDDKNYIWVLTNNGLSRIKNFKIKNLKFDNENINMSIFHMFEDKRKRVWFAGLKNIFYIEKKELENFLNDLDEKLNFKYFDKKDGLKTGINVVSWGAFSKDGKIWIPGYRGLAVLDTENLYLSKNYPPIVIEKLAIDEKEVKLKDIDNIKISKRRMNIYFNSLSYISSDGIKFRYILEGFDKKWSSETCKREVSYTNIPPGTYKFKVIAINKDGIESKTPAEFSFLQKPFFYQTIYFYFVLLFLIIILIRIIYEIKIRNLRRKQKELEKLVNERTVELKNEKEKSDKLLLNILPEQIAEDLKREGKTQPKVFEEVSVLFCDIVGFTKAASEMPVQELIGELNDIFTAFDYITKSNSCERIKTMGDAYLCVCGMPVLNQNHLYRIIRVAQLMLDYIKSKNINSKHKWKIRIGIHTGEVIGGIVGTEKYLYDVFGDTINVASRMEHYSQSMKINVSEEVYKIVKNKYKFCEMEKFVKGKGKMKMYFLEEDEK